MLFAQSLHHTTAVPFLLSRYHQSKINQQPPTTKADIFLSDFSQILGSDRYATFAIKSNIMDPDWLQPKHPEWLETTDTEGVPYYYEVASTGESTYSKPMFVQGLEPPPPPPSASSATSSAMASSASSSSGSSASYQLPIVGSKRKGGRQSSKGKKKQRKRLFEKNPI